MEKTDIRAVLELAKELKTNYLALVDISNNLDDANKNLYAGLRDESGEKVTGFVDKVQNHISVSVESLDIIYQKLIKYAEALINAQKARDKMGDV